MSDSSHLIFDIGANVGNYAIANCNNAHIICVEASPITYRKLEEHVQNINNITCIQAAVCNSDTRTIEFHHCNTADTLSTLDKDWLVSPASRFQSYGVSLQTFEVVTMKLDVLISTFGIPDLIKIDVEGAEDKAVASLTQKVPVLCFEWAAEWYNVSIRVINHLASIGFTEFHIQDGDNYTYIPPYYEYNIYQIKTNISTKIPKQDWGMIWAR